MNDVDIAVLCGISTRVIDPMTKALRANAIEPVFTKVSVDTGSYLESLLANTCATIKALDCDQKIRIRSLTVISGFSKDEDIALEARFFSPLRDASPSSRNIVTTLHLQRRYVTQ